MARGDFKVSKVWGKENPADLLTKFLDNQTMLKHMDHFNVCYMTGRSAEAPSLSNLNYLSQCMFAVCGADAHAPSRAASTIRMFAALRRTNALSAYPQSLLAGIKEYQPRGGARFYTGIRLYVFSKMSIMTLCASVAMA